MEVLSPNVVLPSGSLRVILETGHASDTGVTMGEATILKEFSHSPVHTFTSF